MPYDFSASQIELWEKQARIKAIREAKHMGYEQWAVRNPTLAKHIKPEDLAEAVSRNEKEKK